MVGKSHPIVLQPRNLFQEKSGHAVVLTWWPGPVPSCTHSYRGAPMIYSLDLHEGCSWGLGWGTGAVTPERQMRELRFCPADDDRSAWTFRQVQLLTFKDFLSQPNLLLMPKAAFSRKDSTTAQMRRSLATPGGGAAFPVSCPHQTGDASLVTGMCACSRVCTYRLGKS